MPLPAVALAGTALRLGLVAYGAVTLLRQMDRARIDMRAEEAMDELDEGLAVRRDGEQANATARMRRTFWFGPDGPGLEVDLAAIGRARFRLKSRS